MAVNGLILFNGANTDGIWYENMSVRAVYYGNTLVWELVTKHLVQQYIRDQCVEFIPTENIVLNDISFLGQYTDTRAVFRVFNEVGLCIAYASGNGIQTDVTIYGMNGTLKTSVNTFGTITLYAGRTYYINITGPNSDGMTSSKYENENGRMKIYSNACNVYTVHSSDAWQHACDGSAYSFDDICNNIRPNSYFIWRGDSPMPNDMKPNESGSANPYPYILYKDVSHVTHRFTDDEFNAIGGSDVKKYAYIFYTMGNRVGEEFVMNTNYWNKGFNITGGTVMANNKNHFYTLNDIAAGNHITSMTPIDDEPSVKNTFDLYYKSSRNRWGGISEEAVVIWFDNQWQSATRWDTEFLIDGTYDATNYLAKIDNNYAKDFNKVSVETGDKLYYRINNVEV